MDHSAKSAIAETDPVCGMSVDPASAKHKFEHGGKPYYFCCAGCREKFRADPARSLSQSAAPASGMHSGTHVVNIASASGAKTSSSKTGLVPLAAPTEAKTENQTAYVCPMCPEVRASKPGACPSCGMALEPEMPASAARVEYTCPMHPQIVRPGPGSCPICGMALEPRTVTAHEEDNPELRQMTRRFWISLALTAPLLAIAMAGMLPGMTVQRLISTAALPWT